jgi:peptide/nickel transport system ATP-binding protein
MSGLAAETLTVRCGTGRSALTAVDRVSLAVPRGRTHALVGESGSGKSSLARGLVGLAPVASGRVLLDGGDVTNAHGAAARALKRGVQFVFQNPRASLNPRMSVGDIIAEAILVQRPSVAADARHRAVISLLDLVGLGAAAAERFPHQLSGGQGQRVAIARALATEAPIVILDEVTSALDVSVQANILNLLRRLQRERGLGYLFISHDLAVARYMSDLVSVMYLGRIIETGPVATLFSEPLHPYTRALMDAVPRVGLPNERKLRLTGEIPDPRSPPAGCPFHTRCPIALRNQALLARCRSVEPPPVQRATGHIVRCHAV